MPDVKISQLPAATALAGSELLVVVQSGETRRTTLGAVNATQSGFLVSATGTGSSQSITLPISGLSPEDVIVSINGIIQRPTIDYTIATTQLTTTALSGSDIQIRKPAGAKGEAGGGGSGGASLPAGGTAGQILAKNTATDGDASWTSKIATLDDRIIISTNTHTILAADLSKLHMFTHADGCVVTVPNTLPQGWNAIFVQTTLNGKVTVVPGAGATVDSYGNPETPGQYAEIAVRVDTNVGGTAAAAFVAGGDGGPVGGGGGTDLSGLAVFKATLVTPTGSGNNGFNTIPLDTVITDTHNGWNTGDKTWVVPAGQAGTYDVQGKIRLNDGTGAGQSIGIGINTSNIDSATFFWGVTHPNRNGLYNSDTMVLAEGQAVRLFGYFNTSSAVTVGAAALTIVRIR